MKRLKYILLVGIIACGVGCQKQPLPVELEEPEPVENIENETVSYFGIKDVDDYIEKTLVLSDDE